MPPLFFVVSTLSKILFMSFEALISTALGIYESFQKWFCNEEKIGQLFSSDLKTVWPQPCWSKLSQRIWKNVNLWAFAFASLHGNQVIYLECFFQMSKSGKKHRLMFPDHVDFPSPLRRCEGKMSFFALILAIAPWTHLLAPFIHKREKTTQK